MAFRTMNVDHMGLVPFDRRPWDVRELSLYTMHVGPSNSPLVGSCSRRIPSLDNNKVELQEYFALIYSLRSLSVLAIASLRSTSNQFNNDSPLHTEPRVKERSTQNFTVCFSHRQKNLDRVSRRATRQERPPAGQNQ